MSDAIKGLLLLVGVLVFAAIVGAVTYYLYPTAPTVTQKPQEGVGRHK